MNKLLLLLICCLLSSIANATGSIKTAYSEPFKEPENFNQRLIICKNGNTLMLAAHDNKEIEVAVYDAAHQLTKTTTITKEELGFDKVRLLFVYRAFQIGDELIVFAEARIRNKTPRLVRAHLSPADGSLIRKEEVGLIPEKYQPDGRADHYNDVAQDFMIAKDARSDAYAVATSYSESIAGAPFPYIVHYNGKHEAVAQYYLRPEPRYSFCKIGELLVNGDKELWVASSPFDNGRGERKKGAAVMLSRLRPGDSSSVIVTRLFDKGPATIWMAYNEKEQTLNLMTRYLAKSYTKGVNNSVLVQEYATHIHAYDAASLNQRYSKSVNYARLDQLRRSEYGLTNEYEGLPTGFNVGRDGTVRVYVRHYGLDFGVMDYDTSGTVAKVDYFRRVTPGSNGFFDITYLDTKQGRFVLMNDNEANLDRNDKRSPINQRTATSSDAFLHRIGEPASSKTYLFGKGDNTFDHRFANYYVETYDEASDTYATMIIEQNGTRKNARLAWVQLQ